MPRLPNSTLHGWLRIAALVVGFPSAALADTPRGKHSLFDFDAKTAADGWTVRGTCSLEPAPPAPAVADGPSGTALRLSGGRTLTASAPVGVVAWERYSTLRLWVYRDPAEAKRSPRAVIEVWLRESDGLAGYWRRVDVTHHGWAAVDLPLRWLRPTPGRLPDWSRLTRLEVRFRDETEILIDRIGLHVDGTGPGVEPTLSDWQSVGFPGVPTHQVRRVTTDKLHLMTNAAGLDTGLLARHLDAVHDRVSRDLGVRCLRPPTLLVFATRQQYQAFPIHLADRLDADAALPQSGGFTIRGVATTYWDPILGTARPVTTHEYIHSFLEQAIGLGNKGEWLQEGLATHYQLAFHPQDDFAKIVEQGVAESGGRLPLRRLTDSSRLETRHYWQAATVVGYLLEDPAYRRLLPLLLAAFREAGETDLEPHLGPILGTTWDAFEQAWLRYCGRKYGFTPRLRAGESPDAIRRLARGAKVHVVGISEPADRTRLRQQDIRDWAKLAAGLSARSPPTDDLRKGLETRRVFSDQLAVSRLGVPGPKSSADRGQVQHALNVLLEERDLFAHAAIAGVQLTEEGERLRDKGRERTPLDVLRLNRLMLTAVFPDAVNPPPAESDHATVRVETAGPVVLFLTSYSPCRWRVSGAPGVSVRAIVLSGYGWQDVTGIDAPVVQLSRVGRDGRMLHRDFFYAHSPDVPGYGRVERFVGELTGDAAFEFQGRYEAGPRPFVVSDARK